MQYSSIRYLIFPKIISLFGCTNIIFVDQSQRKSVVHIRLIQFNLVNSIAHYLLENHSEYGIFNFLLVFNLCIYYLCIEDALCTKFTLPSPSKR